jgi:hypothetical protein
MNQAEQELYRRLSAGFEKLDEKGRVLFEKYVKLLCCILAVQE